MLKQTSFSHTDLDCAFVPTVEVQTNFVLAHRSGLCICADCRKAQTNFVLAQPTKLNIRKLKPKTYKPNSQKPKAKNLEAKSLKYELYP